MISESDRLNPNHPNLCRALRWKSQFIFAEADSAASAPADGLFWCLHTQTCIGPDGNLAEPGNCTSKTRACHGTGKSR
jgi:hypothetical protein